MRPTNDPSARWTPPQSCLNPLPILDWYLAALEPTDSNKNNANTLPTSTAAAAAAAAVKRQDEILQTVDFLYGSALDGALSVLESSSSSSVVVGRSAASSSTVPAAGAVTSAVTRLQSPHRSLYTVAASSACGGRRGAGLSALQQQDSCYLCILPENNHHHPSHDTTPSSSTSNIYYCSCRSFLEKSRSCNGAAVSLCKHLLALKLMPVLGWTCPTIHLTSEEEFSRALLQRLSPSSSLW